MMGGATDTTKNNGETPVRRTSAAEWLGLSPREAEFVEIKVRLWKAVKELRRKKRVSQQKMAKLIGSDQSRVSRMEKGDPSVTIDFLIRCLVIGLGVSMEEVYRYFAEGSDRYTRIRTENERFREGADANRGLEIRDIPYTSAA